MQDPRLSYAKLPCRDTYVLGVFWAVSTILRRGKKSSGTRKKIRNQDCAHVKWGELHKESSREERWPRRSVVTLESRSDVEWACSRGVCLVWVEWPWPRWKHLIPDATRVGRLCRAWPVVSYNKVRHVCSRGAWDQSTTKVVGLVCCRDLSAGVRQKLKSRLSQGWRDSWLEGQCWSVDCTEGERYFWCFGLTVDRRWKRLLTRGSVLICQLYRKWKVPGWKVENWRSARELQNLKVRNEGVQFSGVTWCNIRRGMCQGTCQNQTGVARQYFNRWSVMSGCCTMGAGSGGHVGCVCRDVEKCGLGADCQHVQQLIILSWIEQQSWRCWDAVARKARIENVKIELCFQF